MNRVSVMIVDDSVSIRSFIQRILAAAFEDVDTCVAADGYEALAALQRTPVDLVISDINMPGLDGEGLLAQLAGDERLRSIPVLVMTSDSTAARAARMLQMGAAGFLVKPFHAEDLKAEVERILEATRA